LVTRRGTPVIRLTAASPPPESQPGTVAPEPVYLPVRPERSTRAIRAQ
jgi:antitoxin (DNA-binding transcriptional repressor) of toxin-antitoxin stability system